MNLNNTPSIEQLKSLLAACNDEEGHHILWVTKTGEVHISVLSEELGPIGFEESKPEMALRYETFQCGNDYVGLNAASDERFVSRLFRSLIAEWKPGVGNRGVEYIDSF
ncbi:hypothetical protein [Ectopseudomonas khazarica]|uniref:hypothetical protein n=1 Tax=Ectopseudomonas khazarica TaxID=2502979 RepID=UPI0037CAA8F4